MLMNVKTLQIAKLMLIALTHLGRFHVPARMVICQSMTDVTVRFNKGHEGL